MQFKHDELNKIRDHFWRSRVENRERWQFRKEKFQEYGDRSAKSWTS